MLDGNLGATILAIGALGTAAFGIVEGLKVFPWIAEAGFNALKKLLGPIMKLLNVAYGPDAEKVLRAQYRGDHEQLIRVLRQGARIGLTEENAETAAQFVGTVSVTELRDAAKAAQSGKELSDSLRNVLGRFELAVDARIDAAVMLALERYKSVAKIAAGAVAILIALSLAPRLGVSLERAAIVGLAAVPLAPIAKDVATAVKSAAEALRAKVA